jgi:hypothetical protein
MYSFSTRLVLNVANIREALRHEPAIRPNFAHAKLSDLIPIIFALFWNGIDTVNGVYRYLEARDCKFDRDAIEFLINAYEGDEPEHLWSRGNLGDYLPNFEALPN